MSEMNGSSGKPSIQIKGGAGPFAAAAIAAVIQRVVEDERAAASVPRTRRRLSDWAIASRQEPFVPPRAPMTRLTRRTAETT